MEESGRVMNTNDIEQGIIRVISDASQQLIENKNHSDAGWTDGIFTALTKWAYGLNLWVWSKNNEVDRTLTGFLYDFMVCEGKTGTDIDKVWVAMESEWKLPFDEIKYDFYKLIQSRSMLRVMIFQSKDVERTIGDLINILEKSQMSVSGDRYLFAGWHDDNGFTFKSHTKS
jgi:hypothetical protein